MYFTSSPINHDPALTSSWAYVRRIDLENQRKMSTQSCPARCVYILINITIKEEENTCLSIWTEPVLLTWHTSPLKHVENICNIQEIYLGSIEQAGTKNGILRTGICTACMNGNILSSCALLNFFKPSIQLLTWIFPPKQYKNTYEGCWDRRISYYKKWFVGNHTSTLRQNAKISSVVSTFISTLFLREKLTFFCCSTPMYLTKQNEYF